MKFRSKPVQLSVAMTAVIVAVCVFFSIYLYFSQQKQLLKGIDAKLYTTAVMVRDMLPANYHDDITGKDSVSDTEYLDIVDRYNRLCQSLGLEYLWSLMRINDKIVFTTATSPDKIAVNHKQAAFFEIHSNPEIYTATMDSMKPTYQINDDKWGRIRVALVPFMDSQGRAYLFGASMRIDNVDSALCNILWNCLLICLLIVAITVLIIIFLSNTTTLPIRKMIVAIQHIRGGKNDIVSEEGSLEQVELAKHFNQMTADLHEKMCLLQENEENLRITLQSMGDGVITTDADGNITMLNRSAEELTGWSIEKASGKPIMDVFCIYNSSTGAPANNIVETVITTNAKVSLANNTVLISAEGIHRHISDCAAPIHDGEGKLMGTVLIFSDVTERYNLQERLRDSESIYRSAVNIAKLGTWGWNIITGEIIWSDEVYKIHGISSGTTPYFAMWQESIHPDDRSHVMEVVDRALLSQNSYDVMFRLIQQDSGAVRNVHTMAEIERDDQGKSIRIRGVVQDITEQWLTEEKIQESEERFRSTFEQAAVGMAHTTIDGRFIRINQKLCDILGYTRDELLEISVFVLTYPVDEYISRVTMRDVTSGVVPMANFEKRYLRKDGSLIWVNVTSSLKRDSLGQPEYFISIIQDITDRKSAEIALTESENRLKTAQTMALVGNWEIDLVTNLLWASEECFDIYGFKYDPSLPIMSLQLVQAAVSIGDRPMMDRALKALLEDNETYDVEFSIIRGTDGETRYIHSMAKIEFNEYGRPSRILGVFQDITDRKQAEIELRCSEIKHKAMIANIADVIAIIGPDGKIQYESPNIEKWFGWKPEDLVGTNGWDTVHPDDLNWLQIKFSSLLQKDNATDSAEYRYKCKDGNYKMVELTAINMVNDSNINGVLMNYRDITQLKRAQVEYCTLLQTALDGFWIVDNNGRFLEVNDAYCRLTGYSRDMMLKMSIVDIEVVEGQVTVAAHIDRILANGSDRFETRHRRKDGKIVDMEVSCNAIRGSSGRICAFLRDISERKQRETDMIYLGNHDGLTGLYNRTFFQEEINRLDTVRQLPLSIIMGDINGLKLTNDVFGHSEGDKLLLEIVEILKQCCRAEDIIARMGGDEFSILLPHTDSFAAQSVCERIYEACEEHEVPIEGRSYHPSISLGTYTKTIEDQRIDEIQKNAEDSMYKSKLLERKSIHSSLVSSIRATMLEKSNETREHADRLINYTKAIGQQLNLSTDQIHELELLSALHDIGKIGIDEHILSSPNKLTDDEWIEIRKHPEIGYRIALASPELVPIANGILYHHERWDGKGYPQGLEGSKIPLMARILSVTDAFDAMVNDRPYRKALPRDVALQEIDRNAGKQFDPEIVKVFLEIACINC